MNYAIIVGGIVENVIWLSPANAADFPDAIATGNIPVAIGDKYEDGKFYRDGEELVSDADRYKNDLADMRAALAVLGVTNETEGTT